MADSKTEDKVELQWPVAKATIVGKDGVPQSNVLAAVEDDQSAFQDKGALTPPFDPRALINLYEHSAILRQNIDAYKTNIDGFGHRFDSIIDLEADDATDKIRNAIMFERLAEMEKDVDEDGETTTHDRLANIEVTDRDVDIKMLQIEQSILLEKTKLDCFFDFCCTDESFVSLRRKTREDLEVTGNAYWEVLRNNAGEIVEFVHIPGFSVRLMPKKPELVEVPMKVRGPDMRLVEEVRHKRYRTFVQVLEKRTIYFKEFGDPRVVSSKTGKIYKDAEELERAEKEHNAEPPRPATEILHFKVHSPRSAYGVPRWVGNLLNVLGARQAEEVNFLYFENKSVPPMAVLVSGGRVSKSTVDRLEDFVNSEIKGRRNFHKVMILEAEPAENVAMNQNGSTKIQIVPLTDSQQKDALFQNYDERTMDKVGMAFRLPRMLRGDIRDFNRACYDEETETLTTEGWKKLEALSVDDTIAAYDTTTDSIVFTKPKSLRVYDVEEDLLHFRSQVMDIMVTEDHTMLARRAGTSGAYEAVKSHEIPWTRYQLKTVSKHASGVVLADFELPKSSSCLVEREHKHLCSVKASDWLEFLGYWVSGGSLLSTSHPAAPYIVTLSQKGTKASVIRDCLDRLPFSYSESYNSDQDHYRWTISSRCLSEWLRENCGSGCADKVLPKGYLDLCEDQTRILFDALMYGDGHWCKRPNCISGYYPSVSKLLVDQVQILAIRLGYRASVSQHYPAESNKQTCWRVLLSEGKDAVLYEEPTRVPYKGRVYCFSVPGYGFFVTRRNGKVAIQGNTADAALEFAEMQVFSPERRDFDFYMNRKILPELGIELVKYVSNGPSTKDPEMLAEIIEKLSKASVLVPAEARQLAEDVFGRPFKNINEPWTQLPVELTKAGIVAEDVDTTGEDTDGDGVPDKQDSVVDDPEDVETTNKRRKKRKKTRLVTLQAEARRLAQLHAAYSKAEADLASESICKQIDEMRAAEEEDVEVIKISHDKMNHLLGDD